jgi:DNA-binding transcriptional LysR family regulator
VKALEDTHGLKLFHRERRRLFLTEAGRGYLIVIRDALDQIAVSTERLLQRQKSRVLTISTSPDDGQGIALARTALAAWDLINGRLVRPVDVSLRMANTYRIVCPKAVSNVPKIATFRNWVLAEAADDTRRLKALAP